MRTPLTLLFLAVAAGLQGANEHTREVSFAGISVQIPDSWEQAVGTCTGWPSWSADRERGPFLSLTATYIVEEPAISRDEQFLQLIRAEIADVRPRSILALGEIQRVGFSYTRRDETTDEPAMHVESIVHWRPRNPLVVILSFSVREEDWSKHDARWAAIERSERYLPTADSANVAEAPLEVRQAYSITIRPLASARTTGSVPIPLNQRPPEYPRQMLATWVNGAVDVRLVVLADGNVGEVIAVDGTAAAFTDAVRAAVKDWRFVPSAVGLGPSQEAVVEYRILFDLDDGQ